MKKQFLFMSLAAAAMLSSCSTDEEAGPAAYAPHPQGDSEVAIRLASGPATRASIESDEDGLFEVDGLGLFALAREVVADNPDAVLPIAWNYEPADTKTYSVLLDNVEANAVIEGGVTNILFADGVVRYYPMANWYRYGFCGYYPRTENITKEATRCVANITISGKEDVIYGRAVNDVDDYAYSARYFRQEGNVNVVPQMQFDHKLMRVTFSAVPGPDLEAGASYENAKQMTVQSVRVMGVPTEGQLVLADLEDPEQDGQLIFSWDGGGSDLYLCDSIDAVLDPEKYFMEVTEEGEPVEKVIGQGIMLPVPEDGYKYRVAVTLQDSEGTVYECEYPQELRLPEGTQFEAGKSYNVRMTINGPKAVTLSAKLTQWDSDTEDLEGIVF